MYCHGALLVARAHILLRTKTVEHDVILCDSKCGVGRHTQVIQNATKDVPLESFSSRLSLRATR